MIVSHHAVFLKKEFIQDGDSGRKIELEEKIFEVHRVQESESNNELVDVIPPPSHKSSRISRPPKKYLGILIEDLEKAFLVGERKIRNDLKIYDEAMLDVDFEK